MKKKDNVVKFRSGNSEVTDNIEDVRSSLMGLLFGEDEGSSSSDDFEIIEEDDEDDSDDFGDSEAFDASAYGLTDDDEEDEDEEESESESCAEEEAKSGARAEDEAEAGAEAKSETEAKSGAGAKAKAEDEAEAETSEEAKASKKGFFEKIENTRFFRNLYSCFGLDDSPKESKASAAPKKEEVASNSEVTSRKADQQEQTQAPVEKAQSKEDSEQNVPTYRNQAQKRMSQKIMSGDRSQFDKWIAEGDSIKLNALFSHNTILCEWFYEQEDFWDLPDEIIDLIEKNSKY